MRDATAAAELLLPGWVRVLGAVVLLAVAALLALRAARAAGPQRLWHGGYAGVALGMALMFAANPMIGPAPNWAAWIVLVGAALSAVALVAFMVIHRGAGGFELPWVLAAVDLVILAYIQVPSPQRPILLCVLFAAYLAVQVVARAIGAVKQRGSAPAPPRTALVGAAGGPGAAPERAPQAATTRTAVRGGADTMVGLSVLALGMLYMISI